jgi:CRAL/TRIO domain
MVTHPKIETLWIPKGKQRNHNHQSTTMDDNITDNTPYTQTTISNDSKEMTLQQQQNHRIHVPRLRNLLAALSFENHSSETTASTTIDQPRSSKPPQDRDIDTVEDQNTKVRTLLPKNRSNNRFFQSSKVLRGSIINNDQSEIFYDALEYGNSSNKDDFLPNSPRESIVLAGVTTSISHDKGQNHNVVEIVLNDDTYNNGANNDDVDRNKSVEYTEHEYTTRLSTTENINCSVPGVSNKDAISSTVTTQQQEVTAECTFMPPLAPPPPIELPLRFLRAGKNDPVEGVRRYHATLQMRKEQKIDNILREPSDKFHFIKQYYPHYCHYRGKNNEPCFYEQPPKTNLRELRNNGITLDKLLRHYTMVTEYQWQYIERDDLAKSIYIIDLDGIRMTDFVGEAVDFVKRASAFSAQHYPERAGYVFVINVPGWFKLIWNVVKPIIDEDTLKKIYILRGKDEIRNAMQERIPLEHIPPEYGGTSAPLGQSPQEQALAEWMHHNNTLAEQKRYVCNDHKNCKFCTWVPARSY